MAAHPTRQHAHGSSSRSSSSGSSGGAKGAAAGPALVPLGHHAGKPTIPISRPVTVIGSRSTARINLISSTVSKAHALLVKSNGGLYVRDLASRSRVYVNDAQVREADLVDGDEIKVGSFTFKYVAGPLRGRAARDIEKSLSAAELDVTGGEFPIPIDQRVMLIGRRSSADIVLLEDSASTAHAVIFEMDGARYVRDLGSRTGTFVNGVSTHQHKLAPGDIIRIGETDIRYQTAAAAAHAPQALEKTGESATGYALEARDEIELPAHGDDEHETMGGLDLVGEIVKEEVDRYDEPKRQPARTPPQQPPKAKTPPPPLPLELEEVVRAGGEPETPAGEALPLDELEELYAKAAPPPKRPAPSASTDIEDLSDELLADEPVAAESSSAPEAPAETIAPVADETAAAPGAEEAEINIRRGWRSALHEEGQAQADEAREAQAEEPAPAAEQEQTSDVLRFPDQSLAVRDERDEAADTFGADVGADVGGSSADVAVLEPEPILPARERERERDTLSFPDSIDAQARDEDAEAI